MASSIGWPLMTLRGFMFHLTHAASGLKFSSCLMLTYFRFLTDFAQ
jgi:hypothetical protein